jgi:hypothetical protein
MSTRSWQERIEDILDAIAETQLFVSDMSFNSETMLKRAKLS